MSLTVQMHFISVVVNICFLRINEKYISSSTPRNSDVTISFFENRDLEWYSRSDEMSLSKEDLSYRKQIARQLRTQYAEGIYDNPVTLKSRLTVTRGHWKRNH